MLYCKNLISKILFVWKTLKNHLKWFINLYWNGKSWHYLCLNQTLNLACKNIFKIYLVGRIFLSVPLCFCPTPFVCMGGRPDSAKLWLNIGKCVMKIALSFSPSFQGVGVLGGSWGVFGLEWSGGLQGCGPGRFGLLSFVLSNGAQSPNGFSWVRLFVCLPGRPAARFLDYDGSTILTSWAISRSALSQVMHQAKSGGSQRKVGEVT